MHIKHEVGQARGGGVTHLFCAVVGTQSVESLENPHPGGTFPKAAVSLTLQLCLHVDQKAKALPPSTTTMGGWVGGRAGSCPLYCGAETAPESYQRASPNSISLN